MHDNTATLTGRQEEAAQEHSQTPRWRHEARKHLVIRDPCQ